MKVLRFDIMDRESMEPGLSMIWNKKEKKYDIKGKSRRELGLDPFFRVLRFYPDVVPFAGEVSNPFKDKIEDIYYRAVSFTR